MKEHNNRKKANKFAEYITGQALRKYLARKVKEYAGENITLFDGACGSGQLAQHVSFTHLTAVEIQPEACNTLLENFPNSDVMCDSFFNYQSDTQTDCTIMNPPYSIKFKSLSEQEQNNIQSEFDWKKSGVVDDIFVLKSLKYTKRFGVYILFPGVAYRGTEKKFRELLGNQVAELNTVRNGFEDTPIEVILLVVDKQKTSPTIKREIFDCKTEQVLLADETEIDVERWEILREEVEKPVIDIDFVNSELDRCVLEHLENHLKSQLVVIQAFGAQIDYIGFVEKARKLLDEYELMFNFGVEV